MPESEQWMLIGKIVGPFGIQGELKVEEHTDFPNRFKRLTTVALGSERREYAVQGARRHKGRVLLRLAGVETPEAARDLAGEEIAIPRGEAMPLPEGHYYLDDILGAEVFTPEGTTVGRVSDVIQTGANDVYAVMSGQQTILIPVTKDAVRELDVAGRRVIVEPWVLEGAI
jgi:16S rRNA processing protein RimM